MCAILSTDDQCSPRPSFEFPTVERILSMMFIVDVAKSVAVWKCGAKPSTFCSWDRSWLTVGILFCSEADGSNIRSPSTVME